MPQIEYRREIKITMQSFRSEFENINDPIVERDIIDLAEKIAKFHNQEIDDEKFRSLRLARGVYGQRQPGVQMIRIKLPYGKMSTRQLRRIADISDEYASSKLHITTRQDIQIHYVSLDRTPELWARLEQDKITLREACGNTVRNVTASATAGIDPDEPFDVTPYAHAAFEYFLRNPICQEMGRKFKIAFSSSDQDSAFSYIHDIGAIPRIKKEGDQLIRGFKVLIGGGLGAQPHLAQVAFEFLAADQLIPFIEGVLRVFDRYGERNRRQKARMKFLLADIGLEQLLELVKEEQQALANKTYPIEAVEEEPAVQPEGKQYSEPAEIDEKAYLRWYETNVFPQKQSGFYGVYIRVPLGNLSSDVARSLATIVDEHAGDDIRLSINQGALLKYVRKEALRSLFANLKAIDLATEGFDSTLDITACPGTDTCNLGISSSTGITTELERVISSEFPDLIYNNDIKIKISGCPNSCAQHGLASIGFHGSSLKHEGNIMPALQVLLGGGTDNAGAGRTAEKVIKVPSKRGPQVLRTLLADYDENGNEGEYYRDYFQRQGKNYFYELLKPVAQLDDIKQSDFIDWGQEDKFALQTAVGECAGVIIDLVSTLIFDSQEKLKWAEETLQNEQWADSIYHSYNVFITGAKALLLDKQVKNNTQMSVIKNFDEHMVPGNFQFNEGSFKEHVLRINQNEPEEAFAKKYFEEAQAFLKEVASVRGEQVATAKNA